MKNISSFFEEVIKIICIASIAFNIPLISQIMIDNDKMVLRMFCGITLLAIAIFFLRFFQNKID
jgi:hypothetical protein